MKFFGAVIIFLLVFLGIIVLVILHYILKAVRRFRKIVTGDIDDEEVFRRMADKHYRGKSGDPQFDKDYFKGSGTRRKANSTSGNTQQSARQGHTTTTDDGVIIIDNRQPGQASRKIFNDNEGEYVEFTEE